MRLRESEASMRVYGGFTRALLALEPVGPLAPTTGSEAEVAAGLLVYRNNVRAAWLKVLEDTFPIVLRLVGKEFFRYLAHEYFYATRPASPLVIRYGDGLPAFLEGFAPTSGLPYLPDVARLELAWLSAYHAAEATTLSAEEIFGVVGKTPDRACFVLHPSVRLLSSRHAAHTIWRHNREKRSGPLELSPGGERVLIVRPDETVLTKTVPAEVFVALSALGAGASLGEALDAALRVEASMALSDVIHGVATAGVIVSASINTEI